MNNSIFKSFTSNNIFVIDKIYSKADYTKIDLSVSNETLNEINVLLENPQLNKIPAFNSGQVYIVNANAYFSKPTYRLVEGVKIITRTINQKSFNYEPEPDAILNLQNYMHFESFAG